MEEVTTATTTTPGAGQATEVNVNQSTSGAQVGINKDAVENANDILAEVATEDKQHPGTPQSTQNMDSTQMDAPTQLAQSQKALDAAEADLVSKGVDFKALEDEYQQTGALSADSYNKLATAGYPKEVVDGVLNGWSQAADAFVNQVVTMAGGEQEFTRLQQFVATQGDAFVKAYNDAINTNDLNTINLVMSGIKARMQQAYGTTNPTLMGNTAGALPQQAQGYETTDEMIKDMSDPRYQKDMKFTREVYRKVKNAKFY